MPDPDGPTFVVIIAGNCNACNIFKQYVKSKLFEQLESEDVINIITFEFETLAKVKILPEMHKGLIKFARYLPTLFLTTGQLWNNPESKLEGVIYGRREIGGITQPMSEFPLDYNKIYNWINEQLKDNILFFKIRGYNNVNENNSYDNYHYNGDNCGKYEIEQYDENIKYISTIRSKQIIYREINLMPRDMMDYGQ